METNTDRDKIIADTLMSTLINIWCEYLDSSVRITGCVCYLEESAFENLFVNNLGSQDLTVEI